MSLIFLCPLHGERIEVRVNNPFPFTGGTRGEAEKNAPILSDRTGAF